MLLPIWAKVDNGSAKVDNGSLLNWDLLMVLLLLCGAHGDIIPHSKCLYPKQGTPKVQFKDTIQTSEENMAQLLEESRNEAAESRRVIEELKDKLRKRT